MRSIATTFSSFLPLHPGLEWRRRRKRPAAKACCLGFGPLDLSLWDSTSASAPSMSLASLVSTTALHISLERRSRSRAVDVRPLRCRRSLAPLVSLLVRQHDGVEVLSRVSLTLVSRLRVPPSPSTLARLACLFALPPRSVCFGPSRLSRWDSTIVSASSVSLASLVSTTALRTSLARLSRS